MTSPSEEAAEVKPCPRCESTKGYSRVGNFRAQCLGCNSLLENAEVGMEISNEEST